MKSYRSKNDFTIRWHWKQENQFQTSLASSIDASLTSLWMATAICSWFWIVIQCATRIDPKMEGEMLGYEVDQIWAAYVCLFRWAKPRRWLPRIIFPSKDQKAWNLSASVGKKHAWIASRKKANNVQWITSDNPNPSPWILLVFSLISSCCRLIISPFVNSWLIRRLIRQLGVGAIGCASRLRPSYS